MFSDNLYIMMLFFQSEKDILEHNASSARENNLLIQIYPFVFRPKYRSELKLTFPQACDVTVELFPSASTRRLKSEPGNILLNKRL